MNKQLRKRRRARQQMPALNVTPQGKLINTNKRLGNSVMGKMQGSTVSVFDTYTVTAGQAPETMEFFRQSGSRDFPLTNMTDNGKLGTGESLVIERMYLSELPQDFSDLNPVTIAQFKVGTLELLVANKRVIKPIPLASFFPQFNKDAEFADYNVLHLDTLIVIPSLQEFEATIRIPAWPAQPADLHFRLTIEGVGAIVSPNQPL